jgi:hypothetical protein
MCAAELQVENIMDNVPHALLSLAEEAAQRKLHAIEKAERPAKHKAAAKRNMAVGLGLFGESLMKASQARETGMAPESAPAPGTGFERSSLRRVSELGSHTVLHAL